MHHNTHFETISRPLLSGQEPQYSTSHTLGACVAYTLSPMPTKS